MTKAAKPKKEVNPALSEEDRKVGPYQLMEKIGKGGFGTVYKGLNVSTGQSVAVKRVDLRGLSQPHIDEIEMEFKLLEKLAHPNIVTYIDNIRHKGFLHIILDLVENGALTSTLKHFVGRPPEELLAHYTAEILHGLKYLHDQGIIHRDIKGGNILTNKAGHIKLTDFGVATKLADVGGFDDAVGTPYWMAPEIISMAQQSAACDIWSLGCTVVEFLTGKPPYFDVNPMAALYSIVSDDMPLPENTSTSLADFLQECFQKDPNRRISAAGLLKHPWIKKMALKQEEKRRQSTSMQKITKNATSSGGNEKIIDLDEFAEEDDEFALEGFDDDAFGDIAPLSRRSAPALQNDNLFDDDLDDNDPFEDMEFEEDSTAKERAKTLSDWKGMIEEYVLLGQRAALGSTEKEDQAKDGALVAVAKAEPVADDEGDLDWDNEDDDDFVQDTPFHAICVQMKAMLAAAMAKDDELWLDLASELVVPVVEVLMELEEHHEKSQVFGEEWADTLNLLNALLRTHEHSQQGPGTRERTPQARAKQLQGKHIVALLGRFQDSDKRKKPAKREVRLSEDVIATLEMMGIIPAVLHLADNDNLAVRLEAAMLIRYFLHNAHNAFVACGGLGVLPALLATDFLTGQQIVCIGVECTLKVFKDRRPGKAQLCKFFCKAGLLPPLCETIRAMHVEASEAIKKEYLEDVIQLLLTFARADVFVQEFFGHTDVVEPLILILPTLEGEIRMDVLRVLVAVSTNPVTLDALEHKSAIRALVGLFTRAQDLDNAELEKEVLTALFHMCKIKVSRLKRAAAEGIIYPLIAVVKRESQLKQFALPILFAIAKAPSTTCRERFKSSGGVEFLIGLLPELYNRMDALEALTLWLQDEASTNTTGPILPPTPGPSARSTLTPLTINTSSLLPPCGVEPPRPLSPMAYGDPSRGGDVSVEEILSREENILALLTLLDSITAVVQFERVMVRFERILALSDQINIGLCTAKNGDFIEVLKSRLQRYQDNNKVRVSLLKMLTYLYEKHPKRSLFSTRHRLHFVLQEINEGTCTSVIVCQLATNLLTRMKLNKALKKKLKGSKHRTLKRIATATLLHKRVHEETSLESSVKRASAVGEPADSAQPSVDSAAETATDNSVGKNFADIPMDSSPPLPTS